MTAGFGEGLQAELLDTKGRGDRANKALKNKACKSSSEEDEDEDEDDEESDHEEAGRDRSRSRDDDRDDAPQDAEPGDKSGSEGEQHTPKKPTKTLRRMRSKGRGERHWTTRMLFFVALSSVHLFTHVFMKELSPQTFISICICICL